MANKKNSKKEVEEKVSKKKTPSTKKESKKEVKEIENDYELVPQKGISEFAKGMIIGVVITAFIALIVILLILGKNDGNINHSSNGTLSGDLTNASDEMKKFYDYYEREEPTLIVYASTQCGYCVLQEPIVERIAELYDIDYLYMDITQLSSAEVSKVGELLDCAGNGTPTSVIVENGKVVKSMEGMAEGKEYVSFLISGGVLSKDSTYQDEDTLIDITYDKFKELLAGKSLSVILMDQYTSCGESCLEERKIVNAIAKENNIPVYYLSGNSISSSDFIDKLGDWGYSTEGYKKDKSVGIPLLMIVRNGKIVWHQDGNMTEADIRSELKKNKVIK